MQRKLGMRVLLIDVNVLYEGENKSIWYRNVLKEFDMKYGMMVSHEGTVCAFVRMRL